MKALAGYRGVLEIREARVLIGASAVADRHPRRTVLVVGTLLVYAPATGRLAALPLTDAKSEVGLGIIIDVAANVGQEVNGPDQIFSTELAEVYVGAENLRRARSLVGEVLRERPVVVPG